MNKMGWAQEKGPSRMDPATVAKWEAAIADIKAMLDRNASLTGEKEGESSKVSDGEPDTNEKGPPRMDPATVAKWEAAIADIKGMLDSNASLTGEKEGESSKVFDGEPDTNNETSEGNTRAKEKEAEDDLRLEMLFAKGDKQIAENKRMVSELKVLNEDTVKLLEKSKPQGLGDGTLDVEETS